MEYRLPKLQDKELIQLYVEEHYSNNEQEISASNMLTSMEYEKWIEKINNDLSIKKIKVTSIDKLEENYIRIIGENDEKDIDVITNGIFTLDFEFYERVKKIIKFNDIDYLIAENKYGEVSLISLNDGKRLIKRVKSINYISDGLFGISIKEKYSSDKVFNLKTNDYVVFPDNMIFESYRDGLLILRESNKNSYDKHKEMVIDINSNIIIPKTDGNIKIIDKNKFIVGNMVIDLEYKTVIENIDLIMPLSNDKIIILKNRKLFVLNNEFKVLKTYLIGETKKPWYVAVKSEEFITMTFKKKIRIKKHEPRIEKDITVIVNTVNDKVIKMDYIPSLSPNFIFKIRDVNGKKGLMNRKSEIILKPEWDNIKELCDADNKYYFIEKNEKHFIFNSETRVMLEVSYTDMKEFHDGLAIGYNENEENYQLIDETLKPIFYLEHMGSPKFYHKNGVLCYYSGNQSYDTYTIINHCGEVIMPSRMCLIKRNGFGLLEIDDYQTGKKIMFDMNSQKFMQLELNVFVIESDNNKKFDFSNLYFEQSMLDNQLSTELFQDLNKVKKLELK